MPCRINRSYSGKSFSREANNRSEPCNIKRSKPDGTSVTRSAQCCRKSFMALFLVQREGFDNPPLYHANNANCGLVAAPPRQAEA
jgi:hypothetical protein